MRGILYYTDNRLDGIKAFNRELMPWVQKLLLKTGLTITSVSLKPIDFGNNIVLNLEPNVWTMTQQIMAGLQDMKEDYVFMAEHDILYHPSHFAFTPPEDDVFYYNTNGWKCDYKNRDVVFHDDMVGLYGLCSSREKLLKHFERKIHIIKKRGYDKQISRQPRWIRVMGYEPGKPRRRGGISNERLIRWMSDFPNLNIRHRRTATPKKMDFESFIYKPTGWKQATIEEVPGWDNNLEPISYASNQKNS
jgi:hypothetical protein